MPYIWEQEADRKSEAKWWTSHFDDYDTYLQAGSAGELGRRHGLEQVGFWRKILAHPSYDAFWREQAMDKLLAHFSKQRKVSTKRSPSAAARIFHGPSSTGNSGSKV